MASEVQCCWRQTKIPVFIYGIFSSFVVASAGGGSSFLHMLQEQVVLFTTNTFNKRMKRNAFSMHRDEHCPSLFFVAYSSLAVEAS